MRYPCTKCDRSIWRAIESMRNATVIHLTQPLSNLCMYLDNTQKSNRNWLSKSTGFNGCNQERSQLWTGAYSILGWSHRKLHSATIRMPYIVIHEHELQQRMSPSEVVDKSLVYMFRSVVYVFMSLWQPEQRKAVRRETNPFFVRTKSRMYACTLADELLVPTPPWCLLALHVPSTARPKLPGLLR